MIPSLLIANRGEIARRIIRTARRLGVRAIAVYSEADAGAPFVREADASVLIGPPPAAQSYLLGAEILRAARETGAAAIHPGYGFLSENAAFAEQVIAAGLVWVGPPPSAIRAMGLKDAAKRLMAEAGVPVTPGYLGDDQSEERLASEAAVIGWPVLIKAVAGGGGKGMRKVEAAEDFLPALASCRREAASSFGDDRVLLEKYIDHPRHIEVQVFADAHGQAVHLFERDCSLQRRHQKVIEEAPAPGMTPETREAICDAAVRAAKAVDYQGAGTIEFIADGSDGLRADRIWFMEMNTRLQVEHPVTEAVTGLDLVEWQLRVASGEPLPLRQEQIGLNGWAMEARLYAEDPASGFLPSIGPLTHFKLPIDARIDSAVEQGGEVTPYYDPMIAKLIVHAPTREAAAARLAGVCRSVEVWPVKTNAAFLARLRRPSGLRRRPSGHGIHRAASGQSCSRWRAQRRGVCGCGVIEGGRRAHTTPRPGRRSPAFDSMRRRKISIGLIMQARSSWSKSKRRTRGRYRPSSAAARPSCSRTVWPTPSTTRRRSPAARRPRATARSARPCPERSSRPRWPRAMW